ncbi:hypothetical protein Dimus_033731, partial [Dionaea muscipula]
MHDERARSTTVNDQILAPPVSNEERAPTLPYVVVQEITPSLVNAGELTPSSSTNP